MQSLISLKGNTALITGAAQGIGQGLAELFADAGATCVLTDINDELGQKITSAINRAKYLHLDVQQEADWEAAMALPLAAF